MAAEKVSEAALQELLDRQAILDCIHHYTRGMDRHDKALALSAYHPDAIDDLGLYCGVAKDFIDWACWYHDQHQTLHHHYVTNHSVEFDGDVAHAETYWLFVGVNKDREHPLRVHALSNGRATSPNSTHRRNSRPQRSPPASRRGTNRTSLTSARSRSSASRCRQFKLSRAASAYCQKAADCAGISR